MGSEPTRDDDLTTRARIRRTAVELFGANGFERTTVRAVAKAAGVSPGLVIHHFGSKDGLRAACDEWVIAVLQTDKLNVIRGSLPELQRLLADRPDYRPVLDYLVASLRHGGAVCEQMFDQMCALTLDLLEQGARAGTLRPQSDPAGAAAVLVAFAAGASMLGEQLARHLGGRTLLDDDVYHRYAAVATELHTHPLFTDDRFLRATQASEETP